MAPSARSQEDSTKSDAETLSDPGPPSQKQVAYQAAADVIEAILEQGGKILYQHYEARTIIRNTMVVACEAAYSHVDMCFVPHDQHPLDENESDWELESEPKAGPEDPWSAKLLEVRKPPKVERTMERRPSWSRITRNPRLQTSSAPKDIYGSRRGAVTMDPSQISRSWPLQDKRANPDAALEESFRQMWAQRAAERAMQQDEAAAAKNQEAKEESKRRAEALQELKEDRPFAFDSEGRVMFFERKDVERYPRVENMLHYEIPSVRTGIRPGAAIAEDSASSSATAASTSKDAEQLAQAARQGRRVAMSEEVGPGHEKGRRAKKDSPRHQFTDGCRKLEHAQPDLVETIKLEKGVVLTVAGRRKAGENPGGEGDRMAWREYVAMSQGWAAKQLGEKEEDEGSEKTGEAAPSLPSPTAASTQRMTPKAAGTKNAADGPSTQAEPFAATTPASSRRPSQGFFSPEASAWGGSSPSRRPASAHPTGSVGGLTINPSLGATSTRAAAAAAAAMFYSSSWGQGVRPPPVQLVSAHSGPPVANSPATPPLGLLSSRAAAGAVASMGVLRSQPRQPRQKPVVIGGHGFDAAPLAPPLGATMGHGLIPAENKTLKEAASKGQYYCPPKTSPKKADPKRMTRASSAGSIRRPQSASVAEGQRSRTPARVAWR